jgi:hypothetical protein
MPSTELITIPCQFARGGFSSERVFQVETLSGVFTGVAALEYCYDAEGEPLGPDQPPAGTKIKGRVAARFIQEESKQSALLSVPDGSVISVSRRLLQQESSR